MDRRAARPRNSGGRFVMLTPEQRAALLAASGPRVCARCSTTSTTQWRFWVPPPGAALGGRPETAVGAAAAPPGMSHGSPASAPPSPGESAVESASYSSRGGSTSANCREQPAPHQSQSSSAPSATAKRVLLCNACGISLKRRTRRTASAPIKAVSPPPVADIRKPRAGGARRRAASALTAAVAVAAAGAPAAARATSSALGRSAPPFRAPWAAGSGDATPLPPARPPRVAGGAAPSLSIAALLADERRCYYSDLGAGASGRTAGGGSPAPSGGPVPFPPPPLAAAAWPPARAWPSPEPAGPPPLSGGYHNAAGTPPSADTAVFPSPLLPPLRSLPPVSLPPLHSNSRVVAAAAPRAGKAAVSTAAGGGGGGWVAGGATAASRSTSFPSPSELQARAGAPAPPRPVLAPLQFVPRRPYVPPAAPPLSPAALAVLWRSPAPGESRLTPPRWR